MDNVVITGATGFLGSALARYLLKRGVHVWSVVQNSAAAQAVDELKGSVLVECGLAEISQLASKINSDSIDAFYHFAWGGTSGKMRGDWPLQAENIIGSCEAVSQAKQLGAKRFLFPGSIMEYEELIPFLEGNRRHSGSLYSIAKTCANQFSRELCARIGIEYVEMLISNIYGPNERSERFLITVAKKMMDNEHVALSECTQPYDFVYIDDAVKAFAVLGEYGKSAYPYYIGHTEQRPLRDYIHEMKSIFDSSSTLGFGEMPRHGEFDPYARIDTSGLEKLGVSFDTPFSEGVKKIKESFETAVVLES